MSTSFNLIKQQEQIEIERSAIEASRTTVERLRHAQSQIRRYMNPPADTIFPLEYAYYLLGDVRDKDVLDLGCGSGENSLLLALRGAHVTALDISEELIELGKQRLMINGVEGDVNFVIGSAYQMNIAAASVDVVFGMAILHHLELPPVASEVKRVLKKGGRAIFLEPVRNSQMIRFIRGLIPYHAPDVSPFERPLSDRELRDFARGFSEMRCRNFWLPYINLANVVPGLKRLLDPLYQFDGKLLKKFPALGYFASVSVIEIVK